MIISPDEISKEFNDGKYVFDIDKHLEYTRISMERFAYATKLALTMHEPIYIMSGIPGSGKSTVAKQIQKKYPNALIYDATMVDSWRRMPLIAMHGAMSFITQEKTSINIVQCIVPVDLAIERQMNNDRDEGKFVPSNTIRSMHRRLEAPDVDREHVDNVYIVDASKSVNLEDYGI